MKTVKAIEDEMVKLNQGKSILDVHYYMPNIGHLFDALLILEQQLKRIEEKQKCIHDWNEKRD